MAKSMTKSAIIAHLAQKTDLSKKQITDVMDQLLSLATKEAKNVFVLPNFGRLVLAPGHQPVMGGNARDDHEDEARIQVVEEVFGPC